MYKKEVRINGKKYSYYYYNLREEGRVRNVCLGIYKEIEKIKTESHNQVLQTESGVLTRLKDNNGNNYINVLVLDLENAGVAQSGTALDLKSSVLTDLRVRNLGFESNSEIPSSSVQK